MGAERGQSTAPIHRQNLRERNEALDTRVYARAAAWILGVDRWPEARWADLEAQLGTDGVEDAQGETRAGAGAIRPVGRPARRRSVASSYMQ